MIIYVLFVLMFIQFIRVVFILATVLIKNYKDLPTKSFRILTPEEKREILTLLIRHFSILK